MAGLQSDAAALQPWELRAAINVIMENNIPFTG